MSIADKLITIAENEQKVYDSGYNHGNSEGYDRGYQLGLDDGYNEGYSSGEFNGYNEGYASGDYNGYERGLAEGESVGYDKGVTDGKKSEYDAFWDVYQQNGKRTYYDAAFGSMNSAYSGGGKAWTDETFCPKYDITSSYVSNMFCYSEITNIKQRLIDCGVSWIDNSTSLYYTFSNAKTSHIPDLSSTAKTNIQNAFRNNSRLVCIDGIRLDESCSTTAAFNNSPNLEHVIFYGTIGQSLSLSVATKLDKESITSAINILSTSASGRTLTLSKTAVNNAFETADGLADGTTSTEWATLIADKSNWTISLV